jgi:hypothetical protein
MFWSVSMLTFSIAQHPGLSPHIQICLDEKGLASLLRQIEASRKHGHVHLRVGFADGLDEKDPWEQASVGEVIIDWVEDDQDGC